MQTNAEKEAQASFVAASDRKNRDMSHDYVVSSILANAQRIQEMDFRVSNFEKQSAHKNKKQKRHGCLDNSNREKLTNNKDECEPGEQKQTCSQRHSDKTKEKRKGKRRSYYGMISELKVVKSDTDQWFLKKGLV